MKKKTAEEKKAQFLKTQAKKQNSKSAMLKAAKAKNKKLKIQKMEQDRKQLYAEIDAKRGDGSLMKDLGSASASDATTIE